MVTILFSNGYKTFTKYTLDVYGLSDYDYLVKYLEDWITIGNKVDYDSYYNHKVKTFARKLSQKGFLINN